MCLRYSNETDGRKPVSTLWTPDRPNRYGSRGTLVSLAAYLYLYVLAGMGPPVSLRAALVERPLSAELTTHLGYETCEEGHRAFD